MTEQDLPEHISAIKQRGYVVWAADGPSPELKARFQEQHIQVGGVSQVRVWGLQVDDERELPGHERTSIPDEELWQVQLISSDGSRYEVNAALVEAAPQDA